MSVILRDLRSASNGNNGATSVTISQPSTTVAGDRIVVAVLTRSELTSITVPTGWTSHGWVATNGTRQKVWLMERAASVAGAYAHTVSWTPGQGYYHDVNVWLWTFGDAASVTDIRGGTFLASESAYDPFTQSVAAAPEGAYLAAAAGQDDGANVSQTCVLYNSPGWTGKDHPTSGFIQTSGAATMPVPAGGYSGGMVGFRGSPPRQYTYYAGVTFVVPPANHPPTAPTLTSPPNDATLDRGVPNVFALDGSDADPGDSTSQTYWRTRLRDIGAAWTTVTRISPVTTYTFPADYFAAGEYEWQAATRDAAGTPANEAALVWSASSFFTAADAPPAPIFTAPVNGAVIGQSSFEAVISAPDLEASEWRTVADDGAGNADPTTVYSPSVVKATGPGVDLRSHGFDFPVNNRTEHLQARIKRVGLWSQWADSRNPISYTRPPAPTHVKTDDPANGRILVAITNPAPAAGEPAVAYNNVYVDDGDGRGEIRKATLLPANAVWSYDLPRSGKQYDGTDGSSIRVEAVATNGTTSSS